MNDYQPAESKRSFCKRMGLDPLNIRKLARNTFEVYEQHDNTRRAIYYHSTMILEWTPEGDVVIDNGWFRTVTTKDRINSYLPHGWFIVQRKGEWWITRREPDKATLALPIHFTRKGKVKADGSYERIEAPGDVSEFETWKGKW